MIKQIYIRIKKAIQQDLIFIIGNYGLRIASLIFTLLIAKSISPENYGLFGFATLIITYISYFNLGSQFAINKELSIDIYNNKVYPYAILNIILYSLFALIFGSVVYFFNIFPELNNYIYYLILYPIVFNLLEISNGILRAYNKSKQLGVIKLSGAILVIILTIYYFFKGVSDDPSPLFSRFLLFQVIELFVSLFFLSKAITLNIDKIFKSFEFKHIKYLILNGLILSAYITIDNFTKSIDRLFIASFYTHSDLGIYTFGVALQGPFILAISSIMYMDFSRALKTFNKASLTEFNLAVNKLYKKLFLIWGITLLGASILSFLFLKLFLPNYFLSYYIVVIYIFNYFVRILLFPYTSYFISNNLNFELIKILIFPNIINIGLSFLVVFLELPYIFIIIVTLPSNIFYYYLIKNLFEKKIFNKL